MEGIEVLLKKIMAQKESFGEFSLDVYYNDLDDTFVAKISKPNFEEIKDASQLLNELLENRKDNSHIKVYHFRNKNLSDCLLDAFNFVS